MIATAVPTWRREMLAIDMDTFSRLPRPFVNPLAELIDRPGLGPRDSVPFCQLSPYALGGAGIHERTNRAIHTARHDYYLLATKAFHPCLHHSVRRDPHPPWDLLFKVSQSGSFMQVGVDVSGAQDTYTNSESFGLCSQAPSVGSDKRLRCCIHG